MSRDIPDTSERPWASTGWTNDRNVNQMLEFLAARGEVAAAAAILVTASSSHIAASRCVKR